jgi:hypothetical protein
VAPLQVMVVMVMRMERTMIGKRSREIRQAIARRLDINLALQNLDLDLAEILIAQLNPQSRLQNQVVATHLTSEAAATTHTPISTPDQVSSVYKLTALSYITILSTRSPLLHHLI